MTGYKNRFFLTLLVVLFIFGTARSQSNNPTKAPFSGSIEGQLDALLNNSYPYEKFKDIRSNLPTLKNNILDSLRSLETQLIQKDENSQQQEVRIDSLEKDLKETQLAASQRNIVSFLGIGIATNTYHLLLWSLIIGLAILALIFVQRYKSNIQTAQESKTAAEELREEFDQHRKKSMEREQKLKRDLQDELNKSSR